MVALDEIRRVRRAVDLVDGLHDARKRIAAESLDALADAVKDREQAAELAAFGERVQAAAEAGWNACRARNPRFDRSNGVRGNEIHSFQDLPHKLKVQYLTFAQGAFGALEAEAPDDAPAEGSDVVFMRGDRVQITGPVVAYMDASPNRELSEGEVVTIIRGVEDSDGDVLVEKSNGNWTYVRKSSLIPYVPLQVNQRVRVTGPRISCYDDTPVTNLEDGEVVTLIRATPDHDGDVRVRKANGRWTYIRATSLTPVSEGESVEAEARPAESAFQKGDRVKITGPYETSSGQPRATLLAGVEYGTVIAPADSVGDVCIKGDNGLLSWIAATSLTKVAEPRVWDTLEEIPEDVHQVTDRDGDLVARNAGFESGWRCLCYQEFPMHSITGKAGPYTEVLN